MKLRSLRHSLVARLIGISLLLLLAVQLAGFVVVRASIERNARAQITRELDTDVRVTLTWDTDLTDMDLWVIEPSGERCFYGHALTTIGGAISRDFTGGLGPEVYAVRRAMAGDYRIQANFYGSRSQSLIGPTTVQAVVFTNYGRPGEQRRSMTLRLTGSRDVVDIGTVAFEK